ncbi:flagellar biosynthesis protein FlhB [uncultured Abyssibacter sp.]|uniref:flagellar biosynthesis protein FlhB n=1 Tax=uncultured Abyssibacter sp. TaxID=2320202 RepID=UPI0032B12C99
MAENSSAQDKTEKATPKRLKDARKKGQIARSKELTTLVLVGAAGVAVLMLGSWIAGRFAAWMQGLLSIDAATLRNRSLFDALADAWVAAHWIIAPFLAICVVAAVAGPLLLGGWSLSGQALIPDTSRLNPIKGIGRMFSLNALMELGKGVAKTALLGGIAVLYLMTQTDDLLALAVQPVNQAMSGGLASAAFVLVPLCIGLFLIAAVDAPFQVFNHAKQLRMTKQEVRDELKEMEGRPEVKGRIRELQQAAARGRMMEAVPDADVIVTNPTHFAVALKYDTGKDRAPRVVAKGVDHIAAVIRTLGKEHRVPIVEAPPLARVLYRTVDLECEIPSTLYRAVAQVLTYIRQLEAWHSGPMPELPDLGVKDLSHG